MSFTEISYGWFLLVTVPLFWLTPKQLKIWLLIIASGIYIIYTSPLSFLLILGLIVLVHLLAKGLFHRQSKYLLFLGILFVLVPLIYFKYQGMLIATLNAVGQLSWPIPKSFLPLGISFFTFKLIHYLVDVSQQKYAPQFKLFLAYMLFFPIFPAGPIERFPNYQQQVQQIEFNSADLFAGLQRIFLGLFKKIVLADTLSGFTTNLHVTGVSSYSYWIATLAYTFKIYFDFAGYSDIAIGSARLLGIQVMENFNSPYLQRNISRFWKSWHISLTKWFTDYIFIPLGGSRVPFTRIILNTLVVMAVTGLWHGASWHFVLWGLYHGAGLIGLRLFAKTKLGQKWPELAFSRPISVTVTFLFVAIGWVFFAVDARQALYVVSRLLFL